jgi:hypothetical protein
MIPTSFPTLSESKVVLDHARAIIQEVSMDSRTQWWLCLVVEEAVLSREAHQALLSGEVSVCLVGDEVWLDFKLKGGWIDRRILAQRSSDALDKNRGAYFSKADLQRVATVLKSALPYVSSDQRVAYFLLCGQIYWQSIMPGVLFAHTTGAQRFQLLDWHTLWRGYTQGYSLIGRQQSASRQPPTWRQPEGLTEAKSCLLVLRGLKAVLRQHASRQDGRRKIIQLLQDVFPVAVQEGWGPSMALIALEEVIEYGGASGRLLAPITISHYCYPTLRPFVELLSKNGPTEGKTYLEGYLQIVAATHKNQQPKVASLLTALHDRLVIRGEPPLPRSLGFDLPSQPPHACVVWPHEVDLAQEHLKQRGCDERVRKQALLILKLGLHIPLRTNEFFSIRVVDVCPSGNAYLVVYPRGRDGVHKNKAGRMQHDLACPELMRELVEFKQGRRLEEFLPNEAEDLDSYFFGKPGLSGPYKAAETTQVLNDALKWATGNSQASVYDLRHTVISNRAKDVFVAHNNTDVARWADFSRGCGHGSTDSTAAYVHQIERALFQVLHPDSAASTKTSTTLPIPRLNSLHTPCERPALPSKPLVSKRGIADLSFTELDALMAGVAKDRPLDYLANRHDLELDEVKRAVVVAGDLWVGTEANMRSKTLREACLLIKMNERAHNASKQSKFDSLRRQIVTLASDKDWGRLRRFHSAWSKCARAHDLSMDEGLRSGEVLDFLVKCGYLRRQLVVAATAKRQDLMLAYRGRVGTVISQTARDGRADARLFLLDVTVVAPRQASGATLSVVGMHWLCNVLAVALHFSKDN